MFFFISKLIEGLLLPSNAIAVLAAMGVLLFGLRIYRLGAGLMIVGIVLLAVAGWSPLGHDALMELENRFPPPTLPDRVVGIVMLGGAIDTHISADRRTAAVNDAGERIATTSELSRRYADARIILSGGLGHLFAGHGRTESAYAKDLLVSVGVPARRIELEEKSRNTCENAVDSKAIAKPKPGEVWLLVTSASHMPRAVGCFRKVGFTIVPYPVDYRTRLSGKWSPTKSVANGLAMADLAIHEWLGLLAYHAFKGTELFPDASH